MPILYPRRARKNNLNLICILHIDSIRKNGGFVAFFCESDSVAESNVCRNGLVLQEKLQQSQHIDVFL